MTSFAITEMCENSMLQTEFEEHFREVFGFFIKMLLVPYFLRPDFSVLAGAYRDNVFGYSGVAKHLRRQHNASLGIRLNLERIRVEISRKLANLGFRHFAYLPRVVFPFFCGVHGQAFVASTQDGDGVSELFFQLRGNDDSVLASSE